MSRECPICDCEDISPEDALSWGPNHLQVKRTLEAEHDLELTLTQLRKHLNSHLQYGLADDFGGDGR